MLRQNPVRVLTFFLVGFAILFAVTILFSDSSSYKLEVTPFIITTTTELTVGEKICRRTARVYRLCKERALDLPHLQPGVVDRTLFFHTRERITSTANTPNAEARLSFCLTAKQGTQFWKSALITLAEGKVRKPEGFNYAKYRPAGMSYETIPQWLKSRNTSRTDVPSFMTTRNPWTRLVSLYQEKRESEDQSELRDIAKHQCKNGKIPNTFKEMLENCVLYSGLRGDANIHWLPTTQNCGICAVPYDYIISMENMAAEGSYVMEQAGAKNSTDVVERVRKMTIRPIEKKNNKKPYTEYYKGISNTTMDALKDYYKGDLLLFGYPDSPFTESSQ